MPTSLQAAIQASAQRLARDLVRQLRAAGVSELVDLAATRPAVHVRVGDDDAPTSRPKPVPASRGGAGAAKRRIERAIEEEASAYQLTERELEILTLSVHGMPRKALAQECGVAAQTMKMHVRAMLRKMKAESLTDVVARVMMRAVRLP